MKKGEKRNRTRPQYYRIRRILEMIREGTRTGIYPNATDMGMELEVSRPTIMRDLDLLRDDENAPIEYVDEKHGYRLSDETWNLRPVELSRREVFAFSVARRLVAGFRGTPMEMDMQSVFDKIAESLEGKITMDLEALTDRFTVITEDYAVQDAEIWSALSRFLNRQERIKIVYEKFNGDVGTYVLEPYHLFAYHGNWYALANHVRKGKQATFAVSRIRSVRGEKKRFEVPDSFDPKKHIQESFGIVRGDKVFHVRLLFSKKVSGYIKERVWHPSQKMIEKRNGSVELSLDTAGWKELVRWILSWQPDVKVLAPKRLRERIAEKMEDAKYKIS